MSEKENVDAKSTEPQHGQKMLLALDISTPICVFVVCYLNRELKTIRTLVNSDLIRTSAVANSDLGQFGPRPLVNSDPIKTRSELTNAFF